MDRAFIAKEHWGNLILDRKKLWEIRGTGTTVRGRVGVIFSGSGMIYGSVEIVSSSALMREDFERHNGLHRIQCCFEELPYKNPHIWYLKEAIRFKEPIPYRHPQGAVIWVNLEGRIGCGV